MEIWPRLHLKERLQSIIQLCQCARYWKTYIPSGRITMTSFQACWLEYVSGIWVWLSKKGIFKMHSLEISKYTALFLHFIACSYGRPIIKKVRCKIPILTQVWLQYSKCASDHFVTNHSFLKLGFQLRWFKRSLLYCTTNKKQTNVEISWSCGAWSLNSLYADIIY